MAVELAGQTACWQGNVETTSSRQKGEHPGRSLVAEEERRKR